MYQHLTAEKWQELGETLLKVAQYDKCECGGKMITYRDDDLEDFDRCNQCGKEEV